MQFELCKTQIEKCTHETNQKINLLLYLYSLV
jgi:hypothetical protein